MALRVREFGMQSARSLKQTRSTHLRTWLAAALLVCLAHSALAQVVSQRPGIGAVPYPGGVTFRVWAPFATALRVAGTFNNWSTTSSPLAPEGNGNWSADITGAADGQQYKFVVVNGSTFWKNDPRARALTDSSGNSIIRADSFDWSAFGPVIKLFADGFEGGPLDAHWTTGGVGPWRIRTSSQYHASGARACTLDGERADSPETGYLTLTLDASPYSALTLTYAIRNVGDAEGRDDGLFISNGGPVWTRVDQFPGISAKFSTRAVNLSAAAAGAGFVPGASFRIRWQQHSRNPLPAGGVAIDDVTISGRARAPAYSTPAWNDMVIYEMHIGTFNDSPGGHPGTFATAISRLDQVHDLGINTIQVMPVCEFPGDFSWGYNLSYPFAVESAYGGMNEYNRFISECHARGIAVIQDVVHNHYGPNDLDLWRFDGWFQNNFGGIYFYNDSRAVTPWGITRPDFGRPEVRSYIRDNCLMWLQEFRCDGLRWDSTNNIRAINNGGGGDIPDGWSLMQYVNNEIDASQPWKISIAEDLQNNAWITRDTGAGGAGFDSQQDAQFVHPVRSILVDPSDAGRDMFALRDAITHRYNADAFERVIYTESHDEDANGHQRVPEEIWPGNAGSWASQKRSTVGAALVMTSPGIPMIFQGQEILENGYFADSNPVDWSNRTTHAGIELMYRDLIRLRRNWYDTTRGLRGQNINVYHINNTDKVIAFHRWQDGGPRDDVVVVVNLGNRAYTSYNIGFPRAGVWRVRFNSDWNGYSPDFAGWPSLDATAVNGPHDGMNYNGNVGIGAYTVIILSQD